jgi:ribonucleoside-diphosphate reductase beta chain
MAMMFGAQETVHATAYSYLNDTLGLDDYEGFMHEPAIAGRIDALTSVPHHYNYKILCTSAHARRDVARSLAIFSAFTEGVALYSSFAVLYSFQLNNKLKGVGQQMKWSVRDEALHSKMGCQLFRHMCEEFPDLKTDAKDAIIEAAKLTLDMEMKFIDKIFERGDLENLKAYDLKHFMHKRINDKLVELGFGVEAMYYEGGMAYAGSYGEYGDQEINLEGLSADDIENDHPELDEAFCISESIREYEAENEEELTAWIKDGAEKKALIAQ